MIPLPKKHDLFWYSWKFSKLLLSSFPGRKKYFPSKGRDTVTTESGFSHTYDLRLTGISS